MPKNPISKVAKLLRTRDEVLLELERKMRKLTGKKNVFEKIAEENEEKVKRALAELNLKEENKAEEVYRALLRKVKECDDKLLEHFQQPNFCTQAGCGGLINELKELVGSLPGFYLKEEAAKRLFKKNPPRQIMKSLAYDDIDEMLGKENIFELFCALRFAEEKEWLNNVFFKAYDCLTKDDFERREIRIMVLPEKWAGVGRKFLGKKLHHMSHLKELGIAFIIPVALHGAGEMVYLFFMILHYTYETDWHSRLFEKYSRSKDFIQKMTDALKVKTSQDPLPDKNKISWRIAPQYLAKENVDDPRLLEPHISPEAWHYTKTVRAIEKFAQKFPETGLGFWQGMDVVGQCFPSKNGKEVFVSFDLFDNGISFLGQSVLETRLMYHQQEALWNKIFIEYMGEEYLDQAMQDNLDEGWVVLNK